MCRDALQPVVSEGPKRRDALQPAANVPSSGATVQESKAQSFRSTPLGGCSESKARSYATGPGFGGRESSRFLGRETLEKPDNDLSITPHLSVGKGFGASPAKVFDPVQFSSEKLHFTSDKVW